MKRLWTIALLLLLTVGVLTGCGGSPNAQEIKEAKYHLYYISADETEIIQDIYEPSQESVEVMVKELLQFLKVEESRGGNLPLLPPDVEITTHAITEGTLTLDFNKVYKKMSATREVLTRAGVVRLFSQIPGVDYVKFTVDGAPLKDSKGNPLSIMNGETFVEYSGEDINSYQYATIKLYFANKEGTALIPEERTVYYNSNVPLERVVVEQLRKGPQIEGLYPTLPADITIMGVTTDHSNCYLNLDQTFVEEALPLARGDLAIYSIINSLAEDCQVENLQISIDGDSDAVFRETLSLNQFFKKNTELIGSE